MINNNVGALAKFVGCCSRCVELAVSSDADRQDYGGKVGMCKISDTLIAFCKIYHEDQFITPIAFQSFDPDSVAASASLELQQCFASFLQSMGKRVYDAKALKTLHFNLDIIAKECGGMAVVHPSVIKECQLEQQLGLLVSETSMDALVTRAVLSFGGTTEDQTQFEKLQHHRLNNSVVKFAQAIRMQHLQVPSVSHPHITANQLPLEDAKLHLDLLCLVEDVSLVAAWLHKNLLMRGAAGEICSSEFLFGEVCGALNVFAELMTVLDAKVSSKESLAFEGSGWQSSKPIATIRAWVTLMGTFGGRAQTCLLKQWESLLSVKVTACKRIMPTWSACFEGPKLLDSVAYRMLTGKVAKVVQSHNDVHGCMVSMAQKASELQVVPRLQDNDITMEMIAVAKDTMSSASLCSVVLLGIDILHKYQLDPLGPEVASAFLTKHRTPANSTVPEGLWQELEAMSSHAAVKGLPAQKPSPSKRAMSSTTTATAPSSASSSTATAPSSASSSTATATATKQENTSKVPAFKRARRV